MKHICTTHCYRKRLGLNGEGRPARHPKIELAVFDMDGVLVDAKSSWAWVHNHFRCNNNESVERYLKGEIDDLEFIRRDIALWRKSDSEHSTISDISSILEDVPIMKGAKECMDRLAENGVVLGIVSAGLDLLANRVAHELGMEHVYANGLLAGRGGILSGEGILRVPLVDKASSVRQIASDTGIPLSRVAAIGNSCFDIGMFDVSGYGIAFNSEDECVEREADRVITEKDLLLVAEAILEQ